MQEKKLSIVQIIDRLHVGGAEQVLVSLANILHSHGHRMAVITIVTPGPLSENLHANIKFINLHRRWKWNPVTMYNLIKAIKEYDIVHVHSSFNLRYLFLSSQLFFFQKKIFFHEHYGDIEIDKKVSWLQKFIYPKTILIAVSRTIEQWALHALKMKESHVFLLPNIVEKDTLAIEKKSYQDGIIRLVIVSNFRASKNIGYAIQLIHKLNAASKKFHLTIIGQVADKTYFDEMNNLIAELLLTDQIVVIQNCTNVQSILNQFDLAIHTAFSESGPLVLIEYMAQSLPFISYQTGEVAAQIKNNLPECITDTFNEDEWIKKINTILNADKALLKIKLDTAFEKYYSTENYYNNCIAIYKKGLAIN